MSTLVREVMTPDPVCLDPDSTVTEAAEQMRDKGIGDVLVVRDGNVTGIVTDRDIVVRVVAEHRNPDLTHLDEIQSADLETLAPDQPIDEAIRIMRERSVRRIPVIDGGRPVGIVSIGDLAVDRDRESALADISAARPNT
ncbi:MAG TPA: CBS domain-containing protein [Solirubrobacterales bacterium]|jgi:CBS domain-containing protein|nr:CBS domain-containing protein [Solirubrobacterales bacterium]